MALVDEANNKWHFSTAVLNGSGLIGLVPSKQFCKLGHIYTPETVLTRLKIKLATECVTL
jgi:hypothetical protein